MEKQTRQIYYNARVYTGRLPFEQAFIVENGYFTAVGRDEDILAEKRDGDLLIDLHENFVCAGFNDSHMHLLNYGQSLRMAELSSHTDSLSGMLEYLRDFLKKHPVYSGQWLRGRGWNQDYFTDIHRMPSRYDLDTVSTEIPIMITRACGHAAAVNSKALELAGITSGTECPDGGAIGIENGEPDGRFYDNAIELVNEYLPLPGKAELKNMIKAACHELNTYGITSVQSDDYCVFRGIPFERINEAYQELEADGKLTVRVYEQCNFASKDEFKRFIKAGNQTGKGSDLFRIGPLKMLGDGSLGSRTAHLSSPYADDENTCGFSLFSQEFMNEMISLANRNHIQAAVHAIGDACLDEVLNAFELALTECPREDHRHGIVHCQITRLDQLERIARLRLHVYAQSIFLDYDNHIVKERVGEVLAGTSYSWKTLMKMGVAVSNGSDCPVELPDVMKGIECAVRRTSMDGTGPYLPEEAFTVQEAFDSFTSVSASASFEEMKKGKIKPRYLADFTVLKDDPFACPEDQIHSIPVLATYLGGHCVYQCEER